MTRPGAGVAAVAVVLAVLCPLLADAAPAASAVQPGGRGAPAVDQRRVNGATSRKVVVDWQGTRGRRTRSATVPGIGTLTLVCRPRSTMVRLTPYDRAAETQMWLAKHEDKSGPVVAVKNVRVYRWADAGDDGRGGTGRSAHEGLNQRTPVENYSQGFMHGVLSQRPGRNRAVATAPRLPSTSLELSWYWNGFDHPLPYRSCRIAATLETVTDRSIGVDWHGDADAASATTTQVTPLPGFGDVVVTCSPDLGDGGRQEIMLRTDDPGSSLYYERIEGEGDIDDHVESDGVEHDPVLGAVPPVTLPENGMLRLWWTAHGRTRRYVVSSYHVVNNAERPRLNLCEVAAAEF